jgi:hypothetical protein
MMKRFFLFLILLSIGSANSQEQCLCQSKLMRMEFKGESLNGILNSSQDLRSLALPSLEAFLKSDTFKTNVVRDYPMEPMGFPFNSELCLKEKAQGDEKFKNIDCLDTKLCANSDTPEGVRTELCLALPCAMILGSQNMSKCAPKSTAKPTVIHYTEPIGLKSLEMNPTKVTIDNNVLKACFTIDKLDITAGVDLEFAADPNVTYDRMGIDKLDLVLDGKREVCMSARIDLASPNPVSEIKFERMNGNFVSDAMITKALNGSEIHGLTGYKPETLNILKYTALPPLARYFRPTVEEAVQKALATTFQTQVGTYIKKLNSPTSVNTASNSMISEMGVANIAVRKYVDLMECSLLKKENKPIPKEPTCPAKAKDIPNPDKAASTLRDQMNRFDQVTSESIRIQIAGFQDRMKALNLDKLYNSHLKPLEKRISDAQLKSNVINGVQIVTSIGKPDSMSGVGIALPDICDITNPSPHEGKSIPNCPIQTYVDINELNRLMDAMYKSGRLCHSGKGDFVPELNNKGEIQRNDDGSPRGTGCRFNIEEDEDGFRCFLNGAPQLKFDQKSGGYLMSMKTKECFRGAVLLGQGKVGGDINFDIGYTPSICEKGDFCLKDGQAQWSVVPGTARYALKDSSWFNGIVKKTVDKKLNELIGQTIRIPLSSGEGPMSKIPLEADGRIDKGPGYFGACLKPKGSDQ